MTKQDIFNYFYTNSANLGGIVITEILFAGLIISSIIYLTYYLSYKGVSYNQKFNFSLVILNLISIVIMLMISSNIVISLGMVGALSIVRFRTAVKDSRDTVFIFWAISEGLSVGSQNFKLALISTLFISIVTVASSFIPRIFNKYLLIIRGNDSKEIDISNVLIVVSNYTLKNKVRVCNKNENSQEIIIEIMCKGDISPNIIKDLLKIKGVKEANFIIETGETVG